MLFLLHCSMCLRMILRSQMGMCMCLHFHYILYLRIAHISRIFRLRISVLLGSLRSRSVIHTRHPSFRIHSHNLRMCLECILTLHRIHSGSLMSSSLFAHHILLLQAGMPVRILLFHRTMILGSLLLDLLLLVHHSMLLKYDHLIFPCFRRDPRPR